MNVIYDFIVTFCELYTVMLFYSVYFIELSWYFSRMSFEPSIVCLSYIFLDNSRTHLNIWVTRFNTQGGPKLIFQSEGGNREGQL